MSKPFMDRLGIQTYCFRNFLEPQALIEKVLECGLSNVELFDGHCGPDNDDAAGFLQQITDANITICATGAWTLTEDETRCRAIMEFATNAGCDTITADLGENSYPVVTRLASEYGMRIAIHNHGRKHRLGSVAALTKALDETGPEIGLCLDTAWMLDSGEDPVAVAARFKDRLYGIHIKDFVFDRAGHPEDVVVGTGNLALPDLMNLLASFDYAGPVILEYEGDPDSPVSAIKECIQAMHACC